MSRPTRLRSGCRRCGSSLRTGTGRARRRVNAIKVYDDAASTTSAMDRSWSSRASWSRTWPRRCPLGNEKAAGPRSSMRGCAACCRITRRPALRARSACMHRSAPDARPGESQLVSSGIAIHVGDAGYAAVILPRSGLGVEERHRARQSRGADRFRLPGTADDSVWNRGKAAFTIQPLDASRNSSWCRWCRSNSKWSRSSPRARAAAGGFGRQGVN